MHWTRKQGNCTSHSTPQYRICVPSSGPGSAPCLLSSQGQGTVHTKNWLPLVAGPALAIRVQGIENKVQALGQPAQCNPKNAPGTGCRTLDNMLAILHSALRAGA